MGPDSSGDEMSYYIGIGSTTVYSPVLDAGGNPKNTAATNAGDNFIDYNSGGSPDSTYIYDDTTSYEFGLFAHNTDGSSDTLWVGANRDT